VNGLSFAPGVIAAAFSFDGVDDFVDIPDSASLDFTGALTIEAWVKPQDMVTFQKRQLSDNSGYTFVVAPTYMQGTVNNRFDHKATVAVPTDRFSHVAWTYDRLAEGSRLYLNGVLISTLPRSDAIRVNDAPLQFGRTVSYANGTQFWSGASDEIGVYGRALTETEIQMVIVVGHSQTCP
jgi:hypothetical protein